MNDADRERLAKTFKAGTKIEVSRFKGLGEMPPAALKETTMDPGKRDAAAGRGPGGPAGGDERVGGEPDGTQAGAAVPLHPGHAKDVAVEEVDV